MNDHRRLIVALDYPDQASALTLAERLDPARCRLKIGKELFTRCGPALLAALHRLGFELFLDLKFHDIPNTVAGAVRAAAEQGVWMLTVHAAAGPAALAAAAQARDRSGASLAVIGVTVLTSFDKAQLAAVGVVDGVGAQVERLAALSAGAGLDGVVCSAQELPALRAVLPAACWRVTPGIRPPGSAAGDQRRAASPAAAIADGATYLVVGRPITRAADPSAAVDALLAQIDAATVTDTP